MRLQSIGLSNWKGYRRATLQLPDTTDDRNVLVIRGANGAGKTSLLEALVLGLFGRQGLDLVGRAANGDRSDLSYDRFLERALNTGAHGREAKISVALEFVGGEGEQLSLKRTWHFSAGGRHRRDEEDVTIMMGADWELVTLPPPPERDEAIREVVGRQILPRNLAPFFIFDGEHLDRLAGQNLEAQMRSAAELVLGGPELRATAADLRAYARDRRRDARASNDAALDRLRGEASDLETNELALMQRVESAAAAITPVRGARDELVRKIGALHGDSYASFKALFEEREAKARERTSYQEKLRQTLSVDLALALAGGRLRSAAQAQIAAEALRDQWTAGQENSRARFDAFRDQLLSSGPVDTALASRLQTAWESVWDQAPDGCATERRHTHLGEADRHLVAQHLDAISANSGIEIAKLAREVEALDKAVDELEDRIARQRGLDEQSQSLADQLRAVQEEIAQLEAQRQVDVQALDQLRLTLSPLRQEIGRLIGDAATHAPMLRRAEEADLYASAMEAGLEAALPGSLNTLADDVTSAYRAMAHKDVVHQVRIAADGSIALLDGTGRDIRQRDASAGETQIFALSLMAAVSAAYPLFPILMDTPFARLDADHRRNVLRHFSELGVQLILLAHPAELSGDDISALGDRYAGEVQVRHELSDGESVSRIFVANEATHGA